jgi:hypothetical protein
MLASNPELSSGFLLRPVLEDLEALVDVRRLGVGFGRKARSSSQIGHKVSSALTTTRRVVVPMGVGLSRTPPRVATPAHPALPCAMTGSKKGPPGLPRHRLLDLLGIVVVALGVLTLGGWVLGPG